MQVSTIIVSYNTFELTRAAINTVRMSSPEIDQEVIIVDNNSPDESGVRLSELYASDDASQIKIISLESNRGFAAANNVGAKMATGEVLFFLNPDTETQSGAVGEIYRFLMENRHVGAVGPHVINPDGTDQQSITWTISVGTLFKHYLPLHALFTPRFERDAGSPKRTREVEMVKGCALAVRQDAFREAGGWDESYFLYAEERELCYQLKKRGYKTFFLRSATVMHHGGASTSVEDYAEQQIIQQRSALQFIERHHSVALSLSNRVLGTIGFGIRAVVFRFLYLVKRDESFRLRGQAASTILRWFVTDYA
ncbi:MAG: glycosyltransferase family 2 protein [Rhodothermia bacterium]|nr:MAG: glycosyltransferase family 2 protein [Rhodothermia bacterium]